MKMKWTFTLVITGVLASSCAAQFAFGVAPGLNLNGAYFGYKVNDVVVPYISLQYLGGKISVDDGGDVYEVSASVLSPAIGIKYFAIQNAKIKGYFGLSLSKPFLTGKLVEDGDEDPDFKEAIDKVSTFGFELGFGAEYFFDQNFSIGGEYGFRNLSIKYSESDSEYEVKGRISPTYTKFTLNYYFGGTEE
jgi:opacity protein-like surface antigen